MGSNPTPSAIIKLLICNRMAQPEEASASEINTGLLLNNYSGKTRQSLATTGFAARLVCLTHQKPRAAS